MEAFLLIGYFGSSPMGARMRQDGDSDLDFAQGASISDQSVQQKKLRPLAREATLKEVTKGKLHRLLARRISGMY